MAGHKDVRTYWNDLSLRLADFLNKRRNLPVEELITDAFALYAFTCEDLTANATKNKEEIQKSSILLVLVEDALRALITAQREQSPVAVACLVRTTLEAWCNLRLIYRSDKPAKWADRFHRFGAVEMVIRDEYRPKGDKALLTSVERAQIQKASPEWFDAKGKIPTRHWTAKKEYSSLRKIAIKVDLEQEYAKMYSVASKFVHGSPTLKNLYSRGVGTTAISSLPDPRVLTRMSLLGCYWALLLLREAVAFAGAPSIEGEYEKWRGRWMDALRVEEAASA